MILEGFKVETDYIRISMSKIADGYDDVIVTLSGNVIINRDGRFYRIRLVKRLELKKAKFTMDAYDTNLRIFLKNAENIDRKWILQGDEEEFKLFNNHSITIKEKEREKRKD